jgi:hypothetical protein
MRTGSIAAYCDVRHMISRAQIDGAIAFVADDPRALAWGGVAPIEIGDPPAIVNAVTDALDKGYETRRVEAPATLPPIFEPINNAAR